MFKSIFGKSFATTSFACAAAVLLFAGVFAPATFAADFVKQNLNYTDSLDSLANPESGFYDAQVMRMMPDGTVNCGNPCKTWGKIFQMRIDISRFSENGCYAINSRCDAGERVTNSGLADSCRKVALNEGYMCKSQPFTEEMLSTLRNWFLQAREENRTLIVRLAYDGWFDGHKNPEPDQEVVRNHMRQIGPLYSEFSDVVVYVELGLYGSWGEENSSVRGTAEAIGDAMQTLLENSNSEIKTGPRRPNFIATWSGISSDNGYAGFAVGDPIADSIFASKGDTIYRVGMYNDGYLGNSGDMGTVRVNPYAKITREMMVHYLETYAHHVPYGGELVYNSNESRGPINTPRYLSYEGFRTHTSYLNRYYDKNVINAWSDSIFDGEHDPEYVGHDGFTYVRNHLGYRYILRESNVMDSVGIGGKFKANLKIENVGFGNMTQRRKVTLVFKQGSMVREIVPSKAFDPWDLLSRPVTLDATADEINAAEGSVKIMQYAKYGSGLHEVSIEATVPEDLPQGEWDVYVRISRNANYPSDSNYQTVRFGNPVSQFDSTTGSNYIGKFVLSDKVLESSSSEASSSSIESSSSGEYSSAFEGESSSSEESSSSSMEESSSSEAGESFVHQFKLAGMHIAVQGSALYVRGAREVNVFDLNGNLILSRNGLDEMGSTRIEDSALQQNHGVLIVRGKNALGQTAIQKVRLAR